MIRDARAAAEDDRPVLLVDSGGSLYASLHSNGEPEHRRAAAIARAMGEMGYVAMAVGPHDLAGGYDALLSATQTAGLRLLGANVRVSGSRRPIDPYEIVELGGLRVGLIGLARTDHSIQIAEVFSKAGFSVTDPVAAARAAVDEISDRSDIIVILGNLGHREARAVGEEVEGAKLLLTGGGGGLVVGEELPRMLRYEPGSRGQLLLQLDVTFGGGRRLVDLRNDPSARERASGTVQARTHPLFEEVAEDPRILELLSELEVGP